MKYIITLTVLLCSSLFLSCGDSSTSGVGGTAQLLSFDSRLTLAYRIEGKVRDFNTDSIIMLLAFDTVSFNPITINFDGSVWHTPLHHTDSFDIQIPEYRPFMTDRTNGVWTRQSLGDSSSLLFKYPAQVGETYFPFEGQVGIPEIMLTAKVAGFKQITVGSTIYLCYVYEFVQEGFGQKQQSNIYVAPGFAIIRGGIL